MTTTWNYDAFIEQQRLEGISAYDATQFPEARAAHEKDLKVAWNAQVARTKDQIKPLNPDGSPMVKFPDRETMRLVMSDPMYKVSEAYRQKCAELIAGMDEGHGPITGAAAKEYGELGREDLATLMMNGARKDAAIAQYKKLAVEAAHDPVKRLELMELLHSNDPAVKAWLKEGETAVAPESEMNKAMRERGYVSFGSNLSAAMAAGEGTDAQGTVVDLGPNGGQR